MAAELKGKKPPTKEAQKILVRQIKKAGAPLKGKRASDSDVHGARKQIKMARATLRLLRESLPGKSYRAENTRLRDAAKPLSEARDATVLLTAFENLLDGQGRKLHQGIKDFHDELTRERTRTRQKIATRSGVKPSRRLLDSAQTHAAQMQVGSKGWSVIGAGLGRVYKRGRDALDTVRRKPTDAAFHEWRKQTKYLRHQVQLLRPIHPRTLGKMEKQLHELSNHLGDDHDLAVLRVKLAGQPAQRAADPSQRQITTKINHRRLSLQQKALHLGDRIYQEPPAEFCRRVRGYWHNWRGG